MTQTVPLYGSGSTINDVVAYASVDDEDADLLRYRWRLNTDGYAMRRHGGREVLMHRQILGLVTGDGVLTDHEDRNRLNNRRGNLRAATHAQNAQNKSARLHSSRYRGVGWDRTNGKWKASARLNGRLYALGYFADEEQAAIVVRAWRAQHMPFSNEQAAA